LKNKIIKVLMIQYSIHKDKASPSNK